MDREKRLDSWKEIATYLNRDVRTVIRWEKERGLPVRRIPGGKGHGVFALPRELEAWLRGQEPAAATVIAVLPFSTPADLESEYLSNGITEAVIDRLSRLTRLRVMARTTVFSYRGRALDPRVIGKELNAQALVLGSVRRRQRTCEVTAELVDTRDGARLWGGSYLQPTDTLAAIPTRVAREVAQSLRIDDYADMPPAEGPRDPQAFELYLRARHHYLEFSDESFGVAIACLEEAVSLDPEYAQAYAALAECYTMRAVGYADMAPPDLLAKAADCANKALTLNENVPEAHLALALTSPHYTWDLRVAEHHFRRAIEVNPSYAMARHLFAYLLLCFGLFEEAEAQAVTATELDPTNIILRADYAALLAYMGRSAEAIQLAERCKSVAPEAAVCDFTIGIAHCMDGVYDKAIAALQSCVQRSLMHTLPLGLLGYAYAQSGDGAAARQVLERLERESQRRPACVSRALVHAGFGDEEETFRWLDAAYRDRDLHLFFANVWPWFDLVHQQPRFKRLMENLGIPAQAAAARM